VTLNLEGILVDVVQKPHQRTGKLTRGRVDGIKVRLDSGIVGRVKCITPE